MMAYAGPSHLKSGLHMPIPDRPHRWSLDTDPSTPSTVHEADFLQSRDSPSRDSDTRDSKSPRDSETRDSGLEDEEHQVNPGKTLQFLESLQDKIADELRMLEWEMNNKDELLTEILGYHDDSPDLEKEVECDEFMQSSISSKSSLSETGSKTLSEGVMADVETSGQTSPRSWSSSRSSGDVGDVTVGNLTFFASQEEGAQQACLDWYVRLLVNSIMRSVSVIFTESSQKLHWQNLYSDLHLYNNTETGSLQLQPEAEYAEKPLRFSRRFTDSNIFFGDGAGGYYDYTSTDSYHDNGGCYVYDWYSTTEDEWNGYYDDGQTDGGIPPPINWQAPWRRTKEPQRRGSEPAGRFNGLVFENSNLKEDAKTDEDPRMFHRMRFQMHDIHHHLSKLRNQIHGGNNGYKYDQTRQY